MAPHDDILLAALEFTSLSMLGWLAAAAVPWLVHRWYRQPQRTMPWAAVELLLTAVRKRSHRIHLQQWLLLAIRTAILVLVALAVAGPLWRDWALGAGGKARTHRILVVDQSYSMTCEADDITRFERAQQRARQIIEAGEPGDAYSVIGWGLTAENILGRATFDGSLALAAIDNLQPVQTSADLAAALRTTMSAIDRAADQIAAHDVVFLTDLCRNSWAVDPKIQAQIEALAKRASLTVLDVGDARRDNLAIVELAVEPALVLRQHRAEFVAKVRGFGSGEWSAVNVELSVDGQHIDSQPLEVVAGGEAEVRFFHSFVDEGTHTVEVALVGASDGLPIDDRRWLVVKVLPQLRVACFAAAPGAADDVARALAPGGVSSKADAFSSIDPHVMPLSRLSQTDLTDFAAVMLCGVEELSQREAAQIEWFTRQGGGLAVLLGESNTSEGPLQSLLPVQRLPSLATGDFHFDPLDYGHPIVSLFRGRAAAGLSNVSVNRYVRLQPSAQHPEVETVLAFDNGDPALVVDRLGLGRVAVMAIPCSLAAHTSASGPWSSFAVSPSFLPVVRELVSYLVGDSWQQQRNQLVGQQAACTAPAVSSLTDVEIRLPAGGKRTLPPPAAEDRGQVFFTDTSTSGVYSWSAAGKEFARFAVNLDTRESDLSTIDPAALPPGFTNRSTVATAGMPMMGANRSFARSLLIVALALLLAETTVAWLLGRGWG
jgi:hypothetical protein